MYVCNWLFCLADGNDRLLYDVFWRKFFFLLLLPLMLVG